MEREPWHDLAALIAENDRLRDEVEAQRSARMAMGDLLDDSVRHRNELATENVRLKNELRSAREALNMTDSERCRRLQAELDRARERRPAASRDAPITRVSTIILEHKGSPVCDAARAIVDELARPGGGEQGGGGS